MDSSSGNSSPQIQVQVQSSGSDQDPTQVMDQRKRKRMESNRESARRSRIRKQKQLDDLMNQATQLRKDNEQIMKAVNLTTEQYVNVEAENSVLRAQMMELSHRLSSLNEILNYINAAGAVAGVTACAATGANACGGGGGVFAAEEIVFEEHGFGDGLLNNNNPWDLGMGINQQFPVEMFDY